MLSAKMRDLEYWKVQTKTSIRVLDFDINNFSTVFPRNAFTSDMGDKNQSCNSASAFPSLRSKEFHFVKSVMERTDVKFNCEIILALTAGERLAVSAELSYPMGLSGLTRVNAHLELHNADGKLCSGRIGSTYLGQMSFDGNGSSTHFGGNYKFKELWKQRKKYFRDDVLRIRIKFNFMEPEYAKTYGADMLKTGAVDSLIHGLAALRTSDGQYVSDFTIICGSEKFPVHKAILTVRSPVFEKMFASAMKETETGYCEIEDVKPSVFSALLDFVYTAKMPCGSRSSDVEMLCRIALAADKYELLELQKYCLNLLKKNVNCETFAQIAKTFYLCSHGKKSQDPIWELC